MTQQIPTAGWHSSVTPSARVANAMNIITNSFLARPNSDFQFGVDQGSAFEHDTYTSSPDKSTYEARITSRVNELFEEWRRQEALAEEALSSRRVKL
ncbi:hypothetical protein F5Y10DRAFT_238188, partial [Nemania abortiva]